MHGGKRWVAHKGGVFYAKKTGSQQVVPNCYNTPNTTFHIEMLLFNWAQGLRKWAKYFVLVFVACARGGRSSLILKS